MKVNKIKKVSSNGKYKIELNDNQNIVTYDNVILKNNLLFNKEIDNKLLNKINNETEYYNIYNKCISMISRKTRSEKEIVEFLNSKQVDNTDIKKIVKELKETNLLNDLNYTKAYISDRIYLSNDGPEKIKNELLYNDINISMIMDELSKIDSELIESKLQKLINKRISANRNRSISLLRQKIYFDMINLGYDKEMIEANIDFSNTDDTTNLKKDFDKTYNKLQKKETGNMLFLKLKQKLFQKGYKSDDIEKLINEKRC